MQEVQKYRDSALSGGLRERKRIETRARIQAEAMRLFMTRGFEVTTLDEIADAANVSRRSLFHYFESKEEIVFSTKADFPNLIAEAIAQRPANEPLLSMIENALISLTTRIPLVQTRNLACLIRDTPLLSAGDQAKYEKTEKAVARALAARKNLPESNLACRVTAATAIGILKLGVAAWLDAGDADPVKHFKAGFNALRRIAG
jgi:AcrR family transcriptional regulator